MELTHGELLFIARKRAGIGTAEAARQLCIGIVAYREIEAGTRTASSWPELDSPVTPEEILMVKRRRFSRTMREEKLLG